MTHNIKEIEEELKLLLSEFWQTRDDSRIANVLEAHNHQLQKAREEAWVDGFMATSEGYNGEYCGHGGYVTREDVLKIYHSELDQDKK